MNTSTEKKAASNVDQKTGDTVGQLQAVGAPAKSGATANPTLMATERFREAINALDDQRKELVKNAIDNIKPGRTFDSTVLRQINKLETTRNRLIIAHFAWLLKQSPSDVHAIVHQIIEL